MYLTLKLSEVNPLHAKWIVQMVEHLTTRKDLVFNGFQSTGITKAIEKCNEMNKRKENPFRAL